MTQIIAEKPPDQPKRKKRDVNGWLVLDKPVGMTSTHAVSVVKRLLQAKRAGHAGTLDPLASGLLPIALGEATKTVPFVMDGRKIYRFTVRWGEERDTDDAEGRATETSAERPTAEAIRALIPRFSGLIEQVPPRFSAVKIDGERAYDLARDGEVVELAPRPIEIHHLELVETPDPDHSVLAAECGKGTYVRALARDMGRALGCFGHVVALRRTAVGPFTEQIATNLEALQRMTQPGPEADVVTAAGHSAGRSRTGGVAGAAGEYRRRRPACPRTGGAVARARRAGHGGLGVGLRPRRAGGIGAGRKGRIAPAADLQSGAQLALPKPLPGRMILSGSCKFSLSHWRS